MQTEEFFMRIDTSCRSANFNERKLPVDMILIHYTGMESAQGALERLCDESSQVSAHYLVDTDGRIFALVDENKRAWHAGVSFWKGERDVNSRSVGIELVNRGHEFGYTAFPDRQIAALTELAADIAARHGIRPSMVLGHSDVAPARKADPGELFPWKRLAENGLGLWTDGFEDAGRDEKEMMESIGYDLSDIPAALTAFRRHFLPEALNDDASERTKRRMAAVAGLFERERCK